MNHDEVLALYDQQERIESDVPNMRREALPNLVRHVDERGRQGMVIWSRFDEAAIGAAIEEQIAYYEGIGQDFEWKVYGHDTPPDLKERLAARGFAIEDEEALLILDLENAPPALLAPPAHAITRVTDADGVAQMMAQQGQVWGEDFRWLGERLTTDLQERPDTVSAYLVSIDGQVVSSAWIYFNHKSAFAGLWGGSTLPLYRGRGVYTALLAARVQEARARGVRYLTIDASPMSRPIVEKHGFVFMTMTYPAKWRVSRQTTP